MKTNRRGSDEARLAGRAVLGRKTKAIVPCLGAASIPIIDHENLDRVTAETLVESGVGTVVNASRSATGSYPNLGPIILARAGVHIVDGVGEAIFERVRDGDEIEVVGGGVYRDGALIATGKHLDFEGAEELLRSSREAVGVALESFARNTVEFMLREGELLFSTLDMPSEISRRIRGRHVLVVVRGYDYREDLATLGTYLRDVRPFVIAVDGGADALLETGRRPDLVFGDMDSVSVTALRAAGSVLVHGYPGGEAPGLARVREAGIAGAGVLEAPGLSEDVAILLAEQCGAELIVAVGTHVGLTEFLDKGRKGASSTFLMRLRVGPKLVDAKGVSKLYPTRLSAGHLVGLVAAGLVALSAVAMSSPVVSDIFRLLALKLSLLLGV